MKIQVIRFEEKAQLMRKSIVVRGCIVIDCTGNSFIGKTVLVAKGHLLVLDNGVYTSFNHRVLSVRNAHPAYTSGFNDANRSNSIRHCALNTFYNAGHNAGTKFFNLNKVNT